MTKFRNAFVAAAIGWAAALPLATFAASQQSLGRLGYVLVITTYAVGGLVCHQRPERSFHLFAVQMPVCARCVGIYVGAAVVAALGARRWARTPETARSAKVALLVSATPIAATLLYEWATGVTPANWIRAASGLPLGGAVAWIVRTVGLRESR